MTRILLAEDSQTQAFQIRIKLMEEGYDVRLAANGQEALDLVPQFWPHLILTDMKMPVMDGLELVRRCSAQYPLIPIIVITVSSDDRTAVEALESGAEAILVKSTLKDRMVPTIDQVLDVMETGKGYAPLIPHMDYNEFRFTLENRVELIRPLVELVHQMMTSLLLCDEPESLRIGVAVDHALRNAMLHGNLELTTAELEAEGASGADAEPSLVQRRAGEDRFRDRRAHVTVRLTPQQATIKIRDEGQGFDPSSVEDQEESGCGRGIALIRSMMDEVTFQDDGREITMIKHRQA